MLIAFGLGAMILLALIGAVEVICLLSRKFWRKGAAETVTLSIIPAKGHMDNIEYLVRAAQADLHWLENSRGRLIVLNLGLDEESKNLITEMRGVELLEEEEPELHVVWIEKSQEIHVQLMGDVQIEILQRIIKERFGVLVEFGEGSIVYKETIAAPVEGVGHFEPLRHYAEVHLRLEPGERGSGMQFDSECSEDVLDRNWQRLVLTHLEEKEHKGVLTGSVITDMKITLTSGKAHLKHTEGGDFRQATYRAVRQGLKKAESVLLEPYYEFRIELPSENVGRAMTDIQNRFGKFEAPETLGEMTVLTGIAPVSTLSGYQKDVIAYTGGRGRISLTLKGYDLCHNQVRDLLWTGTK